MRILFDNGTPRGVAVVLSDHTVEEARSRGWDTLRNGELLDAAEAAGFDVLLTTDRNIRYQQNLTGRKIAIVVLGRVDGRLVAVSDDEGKFQIVTPAGARVTVRVSLPGFRAFESTTDTRPGPTLDIVLQIAGVDERVVVTAPPPEQNVTRWFELEPVQIYRTAGAQADLFRAIQTLPGVSTADEGAGLFVRGGDVSEVLVSLDDAVMAHPYRHETPTGGFRGAVDPFQLAGLAFSTGGFPARHGNVLSGILDLRGLERPQITETTATVGLAGASASLAAPFGARGGIRGALNRTFTSVLFAVNGSPRRFDPLPGGWDGSAGIAWNLGRAGRLKAFALVQRGEVGVEIEQDAFVGLLASSSRHRFVSARWDGMRQRWTTSLSIGDDTYERGTAAGILDLRTDDRVRSWRVDAARSGPWRSGWRVGANGSTTDTVVRGVAPLRGGDLEGISGRAPFEAHVHDGPNGFTVTLELPVAPDVR